MPRKGEVPRRLAMADPKYKSKLVSKFVNCLMIDGKKSTAESIMYDAFDIVEQRTKEHPLKIFERAMDNVKPRVEVKSRRVGGSTYQVPVEVRPNRREALAIRWLISFAKARGEKSMADRLASELIAAAKAAKAGS